MIFYQNKIIPDDKINALIFKLAHASNASWVEPLLESNAERLQHWREMVAERYDWQPFSPEQMIRNNFSMAHAVMPCTTMFACKGDLQMSSFDGSETIVEYSKQSSIKYGTFNFSSADQEVDGMPRIISLDLVSAEVEVYTSLERQGFLKPMGFLYPHLSDNFGHNVFHAATLVDSQGANKELHALWKKLNTARDNGREVNGVTIAGYEDFMIQLNQQIFLRARLQNTPGFQYIVKLTEYCAESLQKMKECGLPEQTKSTLRTSMEFFISNYVPRFQLQGADPKEWGRIIREAAPEVEAPSFKIAGQTMDIIDLSLAFYEANRADFVQSQRSRPGGDLVLA